MRWPAAAAGAAAALVLQLPAAADGLIPAQPYHYVHPPPALAAQNEQPYPGALVLPVSYLRASHWYVFTEDGQAGISGPKGAFKVASGTRAIDIHLRPLSATPAPPPPNLVVDGNAYQITAVQEPSNTPTTLTLRSHLTLRWPRLPFAIYAYRSGAWSRVCYADQGVITPTTLSCPVSSLGIFAAMVPGQTPGTASRQNPATPASLIRRLWPVLAAALIVLALAAYLILRRVTVLCSRAPGGSGGHRS